LPPVQLCLVSGGCMNNRRHSFCSNPPPPCASRLVPHRVDPCSQRPAGRTRRYVEFRSLQPIDDLAKNNLSLPAAAAVLTQRCEAMLTANECLQDAGVCLALAHKTKELGRRAALLGFAYEFRTLAQYLERDERKSIVRDLSPVHSERAAQ
jgi:hypothetical protein